jgi:hypothetical protein
MKKKFRLENLGCAHCAEKMSEGNFGSTLMKMMVDEVRQVDNRQA